MTNMMANKMTFVCSVIVLSKAVPGHCGMARFAFSDELMIDAGFFACAEPPLPS